MKVNTLDQAWTAADKIIPTDYIKDERASERAGYPIYIGINGDSISDLGCRLEVNLATGESIQIWIEGDTNDTTPTRKIDDVFVALVETHRENISPASTIAATMCKIGHRDTLRAIAAGVNRKAWDGRIDKRNAEWARTVTTEGTNGEYLPGLDSIHPVHLDQLATRARRDNLPEVAEVDKVVKVDKVEIAITINMKGR